MSVAGDGFVEIQNDARHARPSGEHHRIGLGWRWRRADSEKRFRGVGISAVVVEVILQERHQHVDLRFARRPLEYRPEHPGDPRDIDILRRLDRLLREHPGSFHVAGIIQQHERLLRDV